MKLDKEVLKLNITIQLGTKYDIDELEQLYNNINDHLAATTNYPGWKKGIYPNRETAVTGINEGVFIRSFIQS